MRRRVPCTVFFRGVRDGRFAGDDHDNRLWPLLYRITLRKAINLRNRQLTQKRGRGAVRGDSVFIETSEVHAPIGLDQLEALTPSHESIIDTRDQYDHLLRRLNSKTLRDVAEMKLRGYTNAEIAETLGVVERTVERKLHRDSPANVGRPVPLPRPYAKSEGPDLNSTVVGPSAGP